MAKVRVIYEVWLEGFIALLGIGFRAFAVWIFLMLGWATIHPNAEGYPVWVGWATLAWLPVCVGLEFRRAIREAQMAALVHDRGNQR